jgi:adenylate cyclase
VSDIERAPGEDGSERRRRARAQAFRTLREGLSQRLADVLRAHPDTLKSAVEYGLVSREWLDDPSSKDVLAAKPREIVERFIEKETERRPSVLLELGLTAIQLLDPGERVVAGEKVPTGIVFADLAGFTTYTAEHGDKAAIELVARNTSISGPIIRSRGGRVVKRMGDGSLLAFPSPESAVLGSLELVDAIREPLQLRAGAHWGEPVATRNDLIGHDVNVAARVADEAAPSEVLVTHHLHEAAADAPGVRYEDERPRTLRGLPDPVTVCRVRLVR